MLISSRAKRRYNAVVPSFLILAGIVYFAYHAISGERGLLALIQLNIEAESVKNQLNHARAERLELEHRVTLLRPDSLDLDLLDEQARRLLGYSGKEETLYLLDKARK